VSESTKIPDTLAQDVVILHEPKKPQRSTPCVANAPGVQEAQGLSYHDSKESRTNYIMVNSAGGAKMKDKVTGGKVYSCQQLERTSCNTASGKGSRSFRDTIGNCCKMDGQPLTHTCVGSMLHGRTDDTSFLAHMIAQNWA
jgi:hypothetical protein